MAIRHARGRKETMPQLLEGQFAVTKDTEEVFAGINQKNIRVLDEKDKTELLEAVDNVEVDTTNLATKPELESVTTRLEETTRFTGDSRFAEGINVFSHRGLMRTAPENTIPSILESKKYGMIGVELDLRISTDGITFLFHDDTIDRMTNGTGRVGSFTMSQLKELVIDSGRNLAKYPNLKIPTLDEALQVLKDENMYAMLHCKNIDPRLIWESINKYSMAPKIIISTSDIPVLGEFRKRSKTLLLSYIVEEVNASTMQIALDTGNCYLAVAGNRITKEQVYEAHSKGLRIITDTCTNNQQLYDSKKKFVDIILSDIPVSGGIL